MRPFKIKAAARADLKRIALFTEQTWDLKQRNNYLVEIDQALRRLADNSELGQTCDHIRSGYRVLPVGSHLIFYMLASDRTPVIIRVLHKSMNVSSRL